MFAKLNGSIKLKMTAAFLSLNMITLVAVFVFSQYYFSVAAQKQFYQQSQQTTERLNHHMNLYIRYLAQSTFGLISSKEVQQFISSKSMTYEERLDLENLMQQTLSINFPEVVGMFLLTPDKNLLSTLGSTNTYKYVNEPWYTRASGIDLEVLPTHRANYSSESGIPVISLVIPVSNLETLQVSGHLIIDFRLDEIEEAFGKSGLGQSGFFSILASDGTVVFHKEKQFLGKSAEETSLRDLDKADLMETNTNLKIWHGEKWLVTSIPSQVAGWRIVSAVPFDEMNSELNRAKLITLVVLLLIVACTFLLVPMITKQFIQPIVALIKVMRLVSKGDFQVAVLPKQRDEFRWLTENFNSMIRRLDVMMQTVSSLKMKEMQLELGQKQAMIRSLQNQINPHLLYNTLEIIRSMAYLAGHEKIESVSRNLGDIYRYNATFAVEEVTLKDELDHLVRYLDIVKIRFPVYFQSRLYVHEKYFDCRCTKLTLQPIVENAVKYAIEPGEGEGSIIVNAYDEGDVLVIEVADDGPGIPEPRLAELRRMLATVTERGGEYSAAESLGIANVHARLVLKYGAGHGVQLFSFPGRGTVVSIRIPVQRIG